MKISKRQYFSFYLLLAFLEGGGAVYALMRRSSEASGGWIFGMSLQRFLIVLGTAGLAFCFLLLFFRLQRDKSLATRWVIELQRNKASLPLAFLGAGVGISVSFLIPEYRFADFAGYVTQLRPLFLWGGLISVQTVCLLELYRYPFSRSRVLGKNVWGFFLLFVITWGWIAWTGLGIYPDDRYWNEAGVPLLYEQILLSLFLSFLLWTLLKKVRKVSFLHHKEDTFVFFFLWAVTAFFWIREPLPRNFFAPGPYPPTYGLAPYADSAVFDLGGQFALIGEGLFNGSFYARALLSGFLAILHLLFGQNYLRVVTVQTALFSSLVPIMYLLGKRLHSRLAGFLGAFFAFFKGINAIASSTWILSSHPKYMLTEFPTAIVLALFTLWFVRWLNGKKENRFLVLGGGALGLGIMLRTNILFIVPLAIGLFFFLFAKNHRKILQSGFVFLLAFFITISPWMWRNEKVAGEPFFFLDIISEIIRTRYSSQSLSINLAHSALSELPLSHVEHARSTALQRVDDAVEISALQFIPNHFFHNLTTSLLSFPTTLSFHDLRHTIYDASPYWSKNGAWRGELTPRDKVGLLLNLFVLSIGAGVLWKKRQIAGLFPLLVFLSYHLSNAFARTSGGRYLVPVDWVLFLYYAVGLWELLFFLRSFFGNTLPRPEKTPPLSSEEKTHSAQAFFFVLPFFLFVSVVTGIDQGIPARYADWTEERIQSEIYQSTDISEEELQRFLKNNASRMLIGRSLYPRFYPAGEGEYSVGKDAYSQKNYPRLAFTLLGSFGSTGAVLPLSESPKDFPEAADLILLGCRSVGEGFLYPYLDVQTVILLDGESRIVYTREPSRLLQCPVTEPICDDNRHICK